MTKESSVLEVVEGLKQAIRHLAAGQPAEAVQLIDELEEKTND